MFPRERKPTVKLVESIEQEECFFLFEKLPQKKKQKQKKEKKEEDSEEEEEKDKEKENEKEEEQENNAEDAEDVEDIEDIEELSHCSSSPPLQSSPIAPSTPPISLTPQHHSNLPVLQLKKRMLNVVQEPSFLEEVVGVEMDRIAHDLFNLITAKASPMKTFRTKVNAVLFEELIIPHLIQCNGMLCPRKKSSPLYVVQFSSSASFALIFVSLKELGVFNPMKKQFTNSSPMYIVAHEKYKAIWRFSVTLGTLRITFYTQGLTKGNLPINDLPLYFLFLDVLFRP
jgi:hypothetical protein